ncbi:MAG: polyprenyl synthetase family protein [Gammaproteobacteria bacterium]|nr:polyprenyl synthetase family protein [Gammaproteobacteria bacterium]
MNLDDIKNLLKSDMKQVNYLISRRLFSKIELVKEIADHIIDSGGKRIRPMLVLLSANAFNYEGEGHIELATIIEFIHTATLLHDDVVDNSLLRRGLDTANAVWGPQPSVLVGDFLYSRAFQMMAGLKNLQVMDILANTTNTIAEGEVSQLINANDPDTPESRYLEVIRCKTAELFKAAAQLGAIIAERSPQDIEALASYGSCLGMAYQMMDDCLDYTSNADVMGKNSGDDLADGKPTLPLIYAMKHGSTLQAKQIREAIINSDKTALTTVQAIIADTKAVDYVMQLAQREIQFASEALAILPESPHKEALLNLAQFSINRKN